jgi:2-deoxy-D-gluconate 3-dehydrogenase
MSQMDGINSQFSLAGKTALVTGVKKGIGKAVARGLAEAGADIIGVSSSLDPSGSEIQKIVEGLGRRWIGYSCDLSRRDDVYKLLEEINTFQSTIDILINNAGIIRRAPLAEHSDQFWDEVMAVNLTAPFILAREVGRKMVERGQGKIIFVGSLLSFQGGINVPGYAASKGAVARLVQAFANEWAGLGLNINGIAPGYIETDNTRPIIKDKARQESITQRIPQKRWGKPEDLVGPVVFLASEASRYVNGSMIVVDGGWLGR